MPFQPPATVADFKAQFNREFAYGKGLDAIQDADITRALNESVTMFNPDLWDSNELKIAYLYLTAHNLVRNVQAAGGLNSKNRGKGVLSQGTAPTINKSVGQVSQGLQLPEIVASSPFLSQFYTTDFGIKYAQMMAPRLVGHVSIAEGEVDPGVGSPQLPGALFGS